MRPFKANIDRVTQSGNQYYISLVTEDKVAADMVKTLDPKVTQSVEIKKYYEKRSLNANAYFHVLCQKIAEVQKLSLDEVKKRLVLDYGALAEDENGNKAMICLPKGVKPEQFYPYCKWIGENKGGNGDWYLLFKHTHLLDTKQMAHLIDRTIEEANALGIQTKTPDEIARMESLWQTEDTTI